MGEIFLTKIQDGRTKDSYIEKSSSFASAKDEKLCELTKTDSDPLLLRCQLQISSASNWEHKLPQNTISYHLLMAVSVRLVGLRGLSEV